MTAQRLDKEFPHLAHGTRTERCELRRWLWPAGIVGPGRSGPRYGQPQLLKKELDQQLLLHLEMRAQLVKENRQHPQAVGNEHSMLTIRELEQIAARRVFQ